MLEDNSGVLEGELLAHNGRRVHLHAVESDILFGRSQELGGLSVMWQIPVGEDCEEDGQGAFDDEQVPPGGQGAGGDLEDAETEEAAECAGDVGG